MHCTHDKGKSSLFLFPKQEYVLIKLLGSLTVWVTFFSTVIITRLNHTMLHSMNKICRPSMGPTYLWYARSDSPDPIWPTPHKSYIKQHFIYTTEIMRNQCSSPSNSICFALVSNFCHIQLESNSKWRKVRLNALSWLVKVRLNALSWLVESTI